MRFEPLSSHRSILGEGPHWSARRRELLYVDVHGGCICAAGGEGDARVAKVGDRIPFIVETADGGLVVGSAKGLNRLRDWEDGQAPVLTPFLPIEADEPLTSVNDARCDPRGRLWFGTLDRDPRRRPVCALYRWTAAEGLVRAVEGVQISNGLQWSPRGDTLYFIDSHKQRLDAFDYDLATGTLDNRRTLAAIPKDEGLPDGMNVDSEGRVYVALYGGGKLKRYLPDGRFDCDMALPVRFPTSVGFGGDDLRTMFITTSSTGYANTGLTGNTPDDSLGLAGAVLVTTLDVPGQAARPMAEQFSDLP